MSGLVALTLCLLNGLTVSPTMEKDSVNQSRFNMSPIIDELGKGALEMVELRYEPPAEHVGL